MRWSQWDLISLASTDAHPSTHLLREDLAERPLARTRVPYSVIPIETPYWLPGTDLEGILSANLCARMDEGDVLVFSEKALSTAQGNVVDESKITPGRQALFLSLIWMRIVWGYFLGPLCRMRRSTLGWLRRYPLEAASHKQLALSLCGPLQALRHGSEGGIDVTNLPFAYASLPLPDPLGTAEALRGTLYGLTGKKVMVMIVDSDKTYTLFGFHLTPRPRPLKGIVCLGLLAYVVGRALRLVRRATPLAISGRRMGVEEALNIAELADRARGHGAGPTAWEMAERFGVGLTGVTWEMLMTITHLPVVIVRKGL